MIFRKVVTIAFGLMVAGSMLWPAEANAQRRRVIRRVPRASVVVGVGVGSYYYRPYYYRPWFYDPWLPYGYPYAWYPPYGYGRGYDDSSLRLQVEPKETEVFIDGYWAGQVDDFDGFFQRLHLEPGEHDIELYLEGHRSVRQKVYLQPNATFRVRHTMVPLGPGDTPDPRPTPPADSPQRGGRYDAFGRAGRGDRERAPFGSVAIRVQPADAEVLIDGEAWDAPEGSERLVVQLPEGEHRVEIRKEGFTTYISTIHVRRGDTTALNVSLARE